MESIYLGGYTAEILMEASDADCAVLVKAIIRWAQTHEEPVIPRKLSLIWTVIRSESIRIGEERRKDNDRKRLSRCRTRVDIVGQDRTQADTSGHERTQPDNADIGGHERTSADKGGQTVRGRGRGRGRISSEDTDGIEAPSFGSIASVPSDIASGDSSILPFYPDPVDEAIHIAGEDHTDTQVRRTYGKLLKEVGVKDFLDCVRTVDAEFRAGEVPENKGATLVARLNVRNAMLHGSI